ncbi:MAG: hypothetical protein ABIN61_00980 [candidate division WOR-3 bacterium]
MSKNSKPKKLLVFLLTSLILILGCSGNMLETKSVWLRGNINIDGSLGDWEEIPVVSADDNGIFNFKLCNDNDYLYAAFYSRNLRLGGQIKMMGMKLWIDSAGEKNKRIGLFFRGGPEFSQKRDSTMPKKTFGGKGMEFPGKNDPIERETFAIINNKGDADFILKDGSNGPAIEYGIFNGALVYEFKIPLRIKSVESFAIGANPGDIVSLCLELEGGRPEGMRQRPEGGPPGGWDMMNEQMGGGMPPGGGMHGGGMPPGESKSSGKEIWIKVHLASNPEDYKTID